MTERDDAAPPLRQQSPRADPQPRLGVAAELEQQRVDHWALERPGARARRGAGEQAPAGVERGRVGDRLVGLVGQPEAQRGEQVERELGARRRRAGPGRLRARDVGDGVSRDARDPQARRARSRVAIDDVGVVAVRAAQVVPDEAAGEIERIADERVVDPRRRDGQGHDAGRTRRSSIRVSWR